MKLKIYVDRMSQPSRAILIFCKMSRIDFEEIVVDLAKREDLKPEFKASVPDSVKAELLQRIRSFLVSAAL